MPEVKAAQKRQMPFDFFAALAERDVLEASENVRLARAAVEAEAALMAQLRELRELEARGRFLKAGGLTPAVLEEMMGGTDNA